MSAHAWGCIAARICMKIWPVFSKTPGWPTAVRLYALAAWRCPRSSQSSDDVRPAAPGSREHMRTRARWLQQRDEE